MGKSSLDQIDPIQGGSRHNPNAAVLVLVGMHGKIKGFWKLLEMSQGSGIQT
jgi:hypothetical protein